MEFVIEKSDDGRTKAIEVTGPDAESIPVLQDVIDRHLKNFAFREEFEHMPWPQA